MTEPTQKPKREEEVPLPRKVAFLSSSTAYAEPVHDVDVRETHMSWVFLAGDRVYKLKKPVRYPFLDFSTVAAREANCRGEVRLNRRLAPHVYLGVTPLTLEVDGSLALDGPGEICDWLVAMRRLPADSMLDHLIARGAVTTGQVERIGDLLGAFYRGLDPVDLAAEDYIGHFAREQELNSSILRDERFGLPRGTVDDVLGAVAAVISDEPDLIMDRARSERIVDGHGDLRPEHVCLSDPPVIIDCLEFNRRLRLVDPFDEIAFLGMECARLGASWIGEALVSRCRELLGNSPPDRLMAFYTAYRACLRARLSLAHLLERDPRTPEKWLPQALEYLGIARQACVRLHPPAIPPTTPPRGIGE